jgi:T5SS/PEP-CTERM-associated repeat protein
MRVGLHHGRNRARLRAALLASTALLASAGLAHAQNWTGTVSTSWFTAGNWNGGVPATNSSPTIDSTNPGGAGAVVNAATNALNQLNVGVNAQGLLTITTGGSILMNDGILGANAGSTGTAIVTGTGAWNTNNDLVVGGNGNNTPGGTGIFTVQNGGTVTVARDTVISASSGGDGTVTVTGTGSSWTNTRDIYIGGVTTGTFNVLSDGTGTANRDTYLGFFRGATGTLTIDGTNSQWTSTAAGIFDVGGNAATGPAGTGIVNITNGGKLDTTATDAFLGDGINGVGKGTVNISGTNSVWNASNVAVGETGTGILNITNRGVANIGGQAIVGDCDCSNGTVTVSGLGSQFNAAGGGAQNVVIGSNGIGTFNVLDSATANVAGEVVVGQGLGSGTLNVESGASFTANQLTIGSNFATGKVTVSGTGSLLTSNTNTFIGAGSTANNSLNVLDGATGNLGNIFVGVFGGIGTLKVDATSQVNGTGYSQNATSTFNVGISPTTNGKVAITGSDINLDGALVINAKTTQAKTYNIMTTDNGVLGTFSSISVVGNANNLQVLYNQPCGVGCTAVQLTVDTFALANVLPPGTGGNAGHVAGALDKAIASGITIPDAFFNVFALSGDSLVNALSQLSGEPAAGAQKSNIQLMNSFLSLVLNPFGGAPAGNPGTLSYARDFGPAGGQISPQAAAAYAAVTPRDARAHSAAGPWSVWGQAYGGYNKTGGNTTAGTHDTTARTYGLATGFDNRVSGDTTVGFALAGAGENWGLSDGLGGGRADAFQLGIYGSRQFGAAYLSGALAYALHNITTDRTVTVAGSDHLTANFTAQSIGGRIETGYRFDTAYLGVTPYAAAQVQDFFTPNYSENAVSGSNVFALSFQSQSAVASRTELGAWADKTVMLDNGNRLGLRARLAWANDQSSNRATNATFQTLPGASFTVDGAAPSTNLALVTAGADYRLASNISVGGKFDGEFGGRSQTYAGTASVRYVW